MLDRFRHTNGILYMTLGDTQRILKSYRAEITRKEEV